VIGRVLALACAAALLVAADPNDDINHEVRGVLTRYLRFTTTELADLHRGRIVKHSIDSDVPGELAVAGAVRVNVSKNEFLARVRDITRFKSSPDVLQIGRFSDPPTWQDLAALTIDRDDFNPATCHVGDCDVRLPADVIRQFERGRPILHHADTSGAAVDGSGAALLSCQAGREACPTRKPSTSSESCSTTSSRTSTDRPAACGNTMTARGRFGPWTNSTRC